MQSETGSIIFSPVYLQTPTVSGFLGIILQRSSILSIKNIRFYAIHYWQNNKPIESRNLRNNMAPVTYFIDKSSRCKDTPPKYDIFIWFIVKLTRCKSVKTVHKYTHELNHLIAFTFQFLTFVILISLLFRRVRLCESPGIQLSLFQIPFSRFSVKE